MALGHVGSNPTPDQGTEGITPRGIRGWRREGLVLKYHMRVQVLLVLFAVCQGLLC